MDLRRTVRIPPTIAITAVPIATLINAGLHGMEGGEIRPGRNGTVFTRRAIRRRVIARVDVLGIDHTRAGKRHLVSGLDLGHVAVLIQGDAGAQGFGPVDTLPAVARLP